MSQNRATSPGFRDERYRKLIEGLAEHRRQLGMTQQELASRLGLHKQFISRVELGERRLDVVEFVDYAEALGLSPIELLAAVRSA